MGRDFRRPRIEELTAAGLPQIIGDQVSCGRSCSAPNRARPRLGQPWIVVRWPESSSASPPSAPIRSDVLDRKRGSSYKGVVQ
eukprot:2113272-Pyramimonas_sp.AAC.1